MADPYALLAATDERTSSAFEAINRNAIAAFNAEAEAAKFGFQANMAVAEFREQQTHNSFMRDLEAQKVDLREKQLNQSMSIQKLGAARQLAEADREFNYRIAAEARQNLEAQIEGLGTEEAQWRSAALSGDAEAGDKIKEIQNKKKELYGQMTGVFNRLKQEIDGGGALNIGKSLKELDALLEGREPEPAETPDDMLQSIGPYEDPIGTEELREIEESEGVLPRHPGVGPNTLTGSAPKTTEASANQLITTATAKNTAQARDLFPAALQSATSKAVTHFKNWLGGNTPDPNKEPARVAVGIGETLSRQPQAVPDGGVVSLDQKQADHFRSLIGMDYNSVPENMRPSLLQGKKRAYAGLLQAGDPDVKSRYETLYQLGTSPDITQADANGQLEDAVREGMIDDNTRRAWLLKKAGNIERKGKTQDPQKSQFDQIGAALDLMAKAQNLNTSGSVENPQQPIDLGPDFINSLKGIAQTTMAHMQIDQRQRSLMDRIDQARTNPGLTTPDQLNALQIELAETQLAKGRQFAGERLPVLNSSMRQQGILRDDESAVELAKQGQANFLDIVGGRLRGKGMNEADARASANLYYTQYAAITPFISNEQDATGLNLKAPQPIQIQVGPSSTATNTVADNTFTGRMAGFFAPQENILTRDTRRADLADSIANEIGSPGSPEAQQFADFTRSGSLGGDTDEAVEIISNLGAYNAFLQNWSGSSKALPSLDRIKSLATSVADRQTESIFASRKPNQQEIDKLRNEIASFGASGRFDLSERTGYHNALKRVIALKMLKSLQQDRTQ